MRASTSTTVPQRLHEWLLTIPARTQGNVLAIWANANMPPSVRAGFAIEFEKPFDSRLLVQDAAAIIDNFKDA